MHGPFSRCRLYSKLQRWHEAIAPFMQADAAGGLYPAKDEQRGTVWEQKFTRFRYAAISSSVERDAVTQVPSIHFYFAESGWLPFSILRSIRDLWLPRRNLSTAKADRKCLLPCVPGLQRQHDPVLHRHLPRLRLLRARLPLGLRQRPWPAARNLGLAGKIQSSR